MNLSLNINESLKTILLLTLLLQFSTSCLRMQEENYNTEGEFHSVQLDHSLIKGIDGFVIGDYKVLAKQKVKELQVLECNGTTCQGSSYKFDKSGNMIYAAPSYNLSYTEFAYDKYHYIQKEMVSYDGEKIDAIRKYNYYQDSVIVKLYDNNDELLLKKEVPNPIYIHDVEYAGSKQVSKQTIYNMFFPCGEEYPNENEITFEYLKNGLINRVTISNMETSQIKSYDFEYKF